MRKPVSLKKLSYAIGFDSSPQLANAINAKRLNRYLLAFGVTNFDLDTDDLDPLLVMGVISFYAVGCSDGHRRSSAIAHHKKIGEVGYTAWLNEAVIDDASRARAFKIRICRDRIDKIDQRFDEINNEIETYIEEKKQRNRLANRRQRLKKKGQPIPDHINPERFNNWENNAKRREEFKRLQYEYYAIADQLESWLMSDDVYPFDRLKAYPIYEKLMVFCLEESRAIAKEKSEKSVSKFGEVAIIDAQQITYDLAVDTISSTLNWWLENRNSATFTSASIGTKTTAKARKLYNADKSLLGKVLDDMVSVGKLTSIESNRKDSKRYQLITA